MDGVEFLLPGSSIMSPPGKVEVYLKTLNIGLRLPLTDFQEEFLQKDGCSIQMLTPNIVNKEVTFEMICRANGVLPDYFFFKYFLGSISLVTSALFLFGEGDTSWFPMDRPLRTGKISGYG